METLTIYLVLLGAAFAGAFLIARAKPAWTSRRVAVLGSLPLPLIGVLLCIWIFADAAMTPASQCGTDACAMAMGFAMLLARDCLFAYGLAVPIVWMLLRGRSRR